MNYFMEVIANKFHERIKWRLPIRGNTETSLLNKDLWSDFCPESA